MVTEHTKHMYANDAVFHALVDWIAAFVKDGRFSFFDIQQANELAYDMVELERRRLSCP